MKYPFLFFLILTSSCSLYAQCLKTSNKKINLSPIARKQQFDQSFYHWSKILGETCSLLKNKYYEVPEQVEQAFVNGLKAITHTLDPHSTFFDTKGYESIKESVIKGELCGIGVIIDHTKEQDDEFIRIIETIPHGPADKAGIKSDDKILQIDDDIVKGMTLEDAISKIKGKKDSTVTLRIQRSDTTKHLKISITRDTVVEPNALCYEFMEQKIFYMSLTTFSGQAYTQLKKLMNIVLKSQTHGIILDLRNNTGGLLNAVVDIVGLFVPKNSLVVKIKNNTNQSSEYRTTHEPLFQKISIPLFILVNNYTASAAEILAGCLQYYAQENQLNMPFFVVGSKTFGKGSVQEVIPLGIDTTADCALKITTGLYVLPNDISLQGCGVKPDLSIEPLIPVSEEVMWFNEKFGRESALKNAIKSDQIRANPHAQKINKGNAKKNQDTLSWHEKKEEIIRTDYLILSTIRLISLLQWIKKGNSALYNSHTKALTQLKTDFALQKKPSLKKIDTDK